MKKLLTFLFIALGLLIFSPAGAQKEGITPEKATASKGYTVVNPGEPITIYKYVHKAHSPKEAEKYAPKYFFVTGSGGVLQPLTKAGLKKAFPGNHAFHDALDANFKADGELTAYDDFHKIYKINRLYNNSVAKQ